MEMACHDEKVSLDPVIDLAIHLENLLHKHPAPHLSHPLTEPFAQPEPMQLSCIRISADERERRRQQQLCFYCGQPGHVIHLCPVKPK